MANWLMKSEPGSYSWAEMVKDKTTTWEGVRNYQASNNLKAMKKGDRAFFYHSGEERAIVGIVEIVKEYYPDDTDASGRFGRVDVKAVKVLKTPVTLAAVKADGRFKDFGLVRMSRLSVVPVTPAQWKDLCAMGGTVE
ncbi:MAG: EVE domain-containing protein [Alphaproteobacteria bacterium]|nr:EVE domain-containing protein [Alphaproteobacteria bacterium]